MLPSRASSTQFSKTRTSNGDKCNPCWGFFPWLYAPAALPSKCLPCDHGSRIAPGYYRVPWVWSYPCILLQLQYQSSRGAGELLMESMPGGCNDYRSEMMLHLVPVHPACTYVARVLCGSAVLVVVAQAKRCLEHVGQVGVPHHVIPEVVENGGIVGIGPCWCGWVVVVCVLALTKIDVGVELHLSSSHGIDWIRSRHVIVLRWHDHSRWSLWRLCGRSISLVSLIQFRNGIAAAFCGNAIISGRLEELQSRVNSRLPFAHFLWLACVIEQRYKRYHASLKAEPHCVPPGK
jgi:hypothetical protein